MSYQGASGDPGADPFPPTPPPDGWYIDPDTQVIRRIPYNAPYVLKEPMPVIDYSKWGQHPPLPDATLVDRTPWPRQAEYDALISELKREGHLEAFTNGGIPRKPWYVRVQLEVINNNDLQTWLISLAIIALTILILFHLSHIR